MKAYIANTYLLKLNNRNTRNKCKNMFKVNNKNTRTTSITVTWFFFSVSIVDFEKVNVSYIYAFVASI